jgi:ABC-type glycerol-3-phosphate transport system permease component
MNHYVANSSKNIGKYVYAIFIFVFTVFPFFWIVSSSLKGPGEIFDAPPRLIPKQFTFENYQSAIEKNQLLLYTKNSIIVAVVSTLLVLVIATLASYAIGFLRLNGTKHITKAMVATQMFPLAVMIIPLFILCRSLGILNTHLSLILVNTAGGVPIAMILLTAYYLDIPKELGEAARIDGCNTFQTFTKIVFPLTSSGLMAVSIFIFIGVWQEFMLAVSFLSDKTMYTLPVGLTTYVGQYSTDWGGLMATSVVIAIPALILFIAVQKYFIDNLAGSVKG